MDNIDKSRKSFEESFKQADYYNKQTNDDEHLELILSSLSLCADDMILDLGTGSGYLAFAIAKAFPQVKIIGLDIVAKTLKQNISNADKQNIKNISFKEYDGITLPFNNNTFHWIVTRYALHHFPNIDHVFSEMNRILKPGGKLFISDPTPNALDNGRFVDEYMQLKDDGHNKFYTMDEYKVLADGAGLKYDSKFLSKIRFPRLITPQYHDLLKRTEDKIKEFYQVEFQEDECYITEDVLNIIFLKE